MIGLVEHVFRLQDFWLSVDLRANLRQDVLTLWLFCKGSYVTRGVAAKL